MSIPRLLLHGLVERPSEEAVLGRRRISRVSPRRRRARWSPGWSCVTRQRQSGRLLRAAVQQARAASAAASSVQAGRSDHRVASVAAAGRGEAAAALSLAAVRAHHRICAEVLPLETPPLQALPLHPPALPLLHRVSVGGTALPLALALPAVKARDESRVVVATLLLLLVLRGRGREKLVPPALLRRWRTCVLRVVVVVVVVVLLLLLVLDDVLRVLVPVIRLRWRGGGRGRFVRVGVRSRHVQLLHNSAALLGGAARKHPYDRLLRAAQLARELLLLRLLNDLEGRALEALQREEDLRHGSLLAQQPAPLFCARVTPWENLSTGRESPTRHACMAWLQPR